jgi:hypothetical protein
MKQKITRNPQKLVLGINCDIADARARQGESRNLVKTRRKTK